MSEIKDKYERHQSMKSITSITVITRRVVSIDFYRLIDIIDNVYVIDIYTVCGPRSASKNCNLEYLT